MAAIDRVIARLTAQGMSAAQAAAVAASVAAAGYDVTERTTSSPATAAAERVTAVRAVGGRAGATAHAVLAGDDGWVAWVELKVGTGVRRTGSVFVPRVSGFSGDDPFVVET